MSEWNISSFFKADCGAFDVHPTALRSPEGCFFLQMSFASLCDFDLVCKFGAPRLQEAQERQDATFTSQTGSEKQSIQAR